MTENNAKVWNTCGYVVKSKFVCKMHQVNIG